MASLKSFFESRNAAKPNSSLSELFSPNQSKKFQNLQAEIDPSPVVYLKPEEPKEDEDEDLESTIFVGNVPLLSTHKDLKSVFARFGSIKKVWFRSIPVEQSKMGKKACTILKQFVDGAESKNSYVKFEEVSSAEAACELNGEKLRNLTMRVSLCSNKGQDFTRTIFVGNLPLNIQEEELRTHFAKIGSIHNVRVIKNKTTFQGIGIGYVKFATKEQMQTALHTMNATLIRDRPIRVKRAIQKNKIEKKINRMHQKKLNRKGYTPPQRELEKKKKTNKESYARRIMSKSSGSEGGEGKVKNRKTKGIRKA